MSIKVMAIVAVAELSLDRMVALVLVLILVITAFM